METYTYVNIFETKGLEYLLLICFLVLFIFLVRYLQPPSEESRRRRRHGRTPPPGLTILLAWPPLAAGARWLARLLGRVGGR